MMNTLYLSMLQVSINRFFRRRANFGFFLLFFLWLLSFFGLCVSGMSPVISIYGTFFYLLFSNIYFWGAWKEGDMDPFMGMSTEIDIKGRNYLPFMSCLPIDRKRQYAVQVLFYIMFSAAACITSFMIQIIFPQARSHLNLVIYMHFLMFTLLIMFGGLFSALYFQLLFRFKMNNFRDLTFIYSFGITVGCALICVVLFTKGAIIQYLIKIENFFYIIDHPFVLMIPLLAGIIMFWLGNIIFKSIDIRC